MTYKELYEIGCLRLKAADISDYTIDSRLLLEHVCNTTMSDLYAHGDADVSQEKEEEFLALVAKRGKHIPLQHLTGTQCFMGLDFIVTPDVLVPRPDTECLVEEVLKDLHDGMSILDMCTGSGCILLSLLKYSNDCTGTGVDVSDRALTVAVNNSKKLSISADFLQSDLFEKVKGRFDIIVSNPPYIRTCEIEELMPEVRDHDPFIALNGHESGLYFYERILNEGLDHLNRGGLLAFEIGNDQGEAVAGLMRDHGFKEVCVIKDFGGNDRVVKGIKYV